MKTTLDVPDGLYRQIKAQAALKGQTIRAFFLDAIQDKLISEREENAQESGWRTVFGKAHCDDVARLQQTIDEEFSRIDPGEWE